MCCVMAFIIVTGFVFIKIVDPVICNPLKSIKNLGRKLGEKVWKK